MGLQYQIAHQVLLGKGSVLLDRFLNGSPTGVFMHLGNCSKFEIQPKDDKAELCQSLYSSPTMIAQAVKKRDIMVSIEGTDFSADHAQIFGISSGESSLNIAATAVSGETLIAAAQTPNCLGRYFRVAKLEYGTGTAPVVTQNSSAKVAGTDYILADPAHGIIYIPSTSTIDVTGTFAVTIAYTPTAQTVVQVAGHTTNFVQGHILFVPEPADGDLITVDVWKVNLTQNGKIGLISDDYGNWTLEGSALDNTALTPNAPFYQLSYM